MHWKEDEHRCLPMKDDDFHAENTGIYLFSVNIPQTTRICTFQQKRFDMGDEIKSYSNIKKIIDEE